MEYASQLPSEMWDQYHSNMKDVRSRLGESELIVAIYRGRIAGAVTFYPDGRHYGTPDWPEDLAVLRLLAVHPDTRRLGIGRALTDECIRRCKELGVSTLLLHNMEEQATARGMYERMGFQRAPEFDFRPTEDRVVMAYKLDL